VPDHMDGYPMLALLGGLLGAKLYYLIANLGQVLERPLRTIVSGSGLTWYGGALGGAFAVLAYAHRKGQSLWAMCDAFSPGLALAYAIGRIGCHLSGDGDYGPPTTLPWGYSYAKGMVPSPTGELCHPTPIYEMLGMGLAFLILWRLRKRFTGNGQLFGIYLVLAGGERFLAEFVRCNDAVALGLSVAQWTSIVALLLGLAIFYSRRPRHLAN